MCNIAPVQRLANSCQISRDFERDPSIIGSSSSQTDRDSTSDISGTDPSNVTRLSATGHPDPSGEPLVAPGAKLIRPVSPWSNPCSIAVTSMVTLFVTGIAFCLGHHFYYRWLDGQLVHSTNRQQWALRFGNAFAFLAKCCFCGSVQMSFTQWLWRTMQRKYITIQGIDAAFAANDALSSLWNLEMLLRMRTLTLLAMAAWCLPIIALVTPATLAVSAASIPDVSTASVPIPISFNYYNDREVDLTRWASLRTDNTLSFEGETSVVSIEDVSPPFANLLLATATTGQLFPIPRPFPAGNMTYSAEFIAPRLSCEESSPEVARNTTIAAIHSQGYLGNDIGNHRFNISGVNHTKLEYYWAYPSSRTAHLRIGYYALIPFSGASDEDVSNVLGYNHSDHGFTEGNKNELWIVIANRKSHIPNFLTCQWWNATWTINVTTTGVEQTVRVTNTQKHNRIAEAFSTWNSTSPWNSTSSFDFDQALSTTQFRGIAKHLLGYMGTSKEYGSSTWKPVISSRIQETIFTKSSEYAAMFESITSGDTAFLRGPSWHLRDMIEEFSQNVTLNLMTEEYFSIHAERPVNRVQSMTVYIYELRNLILAYGFAILGSLVILCIGIYAIRSNGASYDLSVSTIIQTTQNSDIKRLVGDRTTGCQPLDLDIANTKLRFGTIRTRAWPDTKESTHIGFGLEGTVSHPVRTDRAER